MLEEVRTIYANQRWVRYTTGIGVLACAALFYLGSGGLPPRSWLMLARALSQFSQLSAARGSDFLLLFAGLIILVLLQLATWFFLIFMFCWTLRQEWLYVHEWRMIKASIRKAQEMIASDAMSEPREEQTAPLEPVGASAAYNGHRGSPFPAAAPSRPISEEITSPDLSWAREQAGVAAPTLAPPVSPASSYTLLVGTGWDTGIKRKDRPNEDWLLTYQTTLDSHSGVQQCGLFIVADGMGGHANGREGSHMAIHAMRNTIIPALAEEDELDRQTMATLLTEGVQQANTSIYQYNQELGSDTGTTITAALIVGEHAFVANVGDSRTYCYRETEGLTKITRDHSTVARLVESGQIAPEEVYTHPQRNEIYRSLGEDALVDIDTFAIPIERGMTLLLCSDGLWEMVRDVRIAEILHDTLPNAEQASQLLLQAALDGGGLDNISVIVVHVQ